MKVTRQRLASLAGLSLAVCGISYGVYLRYWRVPGLNATLRPVRPPSASELLLGRDPPDPSCEPDLGSGSPIETTLCDVIEHPNNFACKRVRFRANFETDCIENSLLLDSGCERGVAPYGSPDAAASDFFDGACSSNPIDRRAKRTATFTGQFRLRSENRRTIYALEIERVANIEVSATVPPK